MSGPLAGVTVIEIASLGPGPWAAMMLSDLGAEVIRVDRASDVGADDATPIDIGARRGRRSIAVDLRHPEGAEVVLELVAGADALIEGARPGVAERLGIGPEPCRRRNPRLVYGRMTGWGQEGPLASTPGHDLSYVASTGLLHAIGPADGRPAAPLNLVADYGGGGMLLVVGVVSALLSAARTGEGQVVDAAMVDGASLLGSVVHALHGTGEWRDDREANLLDGGAPYYGTYETADRRWVAVAVYEPKFYAVLVEALGFSLDELPPQEDRASWPALRERFAAVFATRTRDEWVQRLGPLETCFAPVLTLAEAPTAPHAVSRGAFVEVDGVRQPAPAPRFSGTPARVARPRARAGEHTDAILRDAGWSSERIDHLRDAGAIVQRRSNI